MSDAARPVRWGAGALLAVVVAFGLVAGLYDLHDPDVWWVAAAGRERLLHGTIPSTNLFSFTDPTHPWLMHEWLLAVPYAWMLTHLGPGAFALGAVVQTAIATSLIVRFFRAETRHALAFVVLSVTTLALFGLRFLTLRPTHVALLVALAFASLTYRKGLDTSRVAWLVLLQLVWTNLHGSFVVGPCIALGALLVYPQEWRPRALVASLVTVATFVTPYGLDEHRFVLEYFLGRGDVYRVIHAHVEDFAPLYALSFTDKPLTFVGFFTIVTAFGLLVTSRKNLARAVTVFVLMLAALKNARHLDVAGLVSMILVAPQASEVLSPRGADADPPWGRRFPRVLVGAVLSAGLAGFLLRAALPTSTARFVTPDGTSGDAWVQALSKVPDGGRLYVPFSAGGVAIWYGATRGIRVFYDPRNDCYSPEVAQDAFALEFGSGGAATVTGTLARYGTSYVIAPRKHPVAAALKGSRAFREHAGGELAFFRADGM